jgi:cytolysin (calcineurin-like family phosphatase)
MYEYFVNHVDNVLAAKNFDYNEGSAYYDFPSYHKDRMGSLSYSFDIGPIHFVQLNNHPTYTTSWEYWNFWDALNDKFFVEDPALAWLEADLKAASEAGQHIFLNYHDPDGWGDGKADGSTDSYFESLLGQYKVTAIFAGHKHDELGEFMDYDNVHSGTVDVPVILSGGVEAKSALMVRFNNNKDEVVVKTIDTTGGTYQTLEKTTYTMY